MRGTTHHSDILNLNSEEKLTHLKHEHYEKNKEQYFNCSDGLSCSDSKALTEMWEMWLNANK